MGELRLRKGSGDEDCAVALVGVGRGGKEVEAVLLRGGG